MRDSNFVIHHIGGRAGDRAFPIVPALEHEFVVVMYEASDDGNEQIISYGDKKGTGQTILINACVGAPNKEQTFYLNRDPFTSSLLKLDSEYSNFYLPTKKFDYVLGEAISPVKEEKVFTEALDQIIRSRDLPKCDFLSIDTQGSELEILQSAEETLKDCVGVELEVAFEKRYAGQPLFGEIDIFMRDHGFKFVRFTNLKEWAPRTLGSDLRGTKLHIETDAIYFKSPENLSPSQIYPFLLTALVFGQTEYAAFVVQSLGRPMPMDQNSSWMGFCDSFLAIMSKDQKLRPSLAEVMTVEQSFARFVDKDPKKERVTGVKGALRKAYWSIPVSLRNQIQRVERWRRERHFSRRLKRLQPSELESLYQSVGLSKLAMALKMARK